VSRNGAWGGATSFLRGHYPDQVRRSAAGPLNEAAALSARLPELPLRCFPVVMERLRGAKGGVKREEMVRMGVISITERRRLAGSSRLDDWCAYVRGNKLERMRRIALGRVILEARELAW
jgi:hypothetical protein